MEQTMAMAQHDMPAAGSGGNPSSRDVLKYAPAAALGATGATVTMPAMAVESDCAELWRAFLEADELDGELYFAAEDGEVTQAEADAAHADKLRLLHAIIEAPTSPGAMLNRARLLVWFQGCP
jgi:hypothetical protein